jgi:CelD/BcsL family acetyltransferase involved in cellulose biosynthesis
MQIELVSDEQGWKNLAPHWNSLLQGSHIKLPFLSYEFQRAWWKRKGGDEWPDARLNILLGYEDHKLRAIAPLFRVENEGRTELRFIGSHEISDFLDFICKKEDLPSFLNSLFAFLQSDLESNWNLIDLCNLLDHSESLAIIREVAHKHNLKFNSETLQASPYIPIPEQFDVYAESLDSKHAHELRRKMRRASRYPLPIEMEIVGQEDNYEEALSDFFSLMVMEDEKADFLTSKMRTQMNEIGIAAFKNGWGQLVFLKIGDERSAAFLNFDYDNQIWAYNGGLNPKFADLSPGWLLMAEMIDWCIDNKREVFDFMRGDEEYKYRFGAIDRFVLRATISKN